MFNSLSTAKLFSAMVVPFYIDTVTALSELRVLIFPQPCQHLLSLSFFCFLNSSHLARCEATSLMVLICISLTKMTNGG